MGGAAGDQIEDAVLLQAAEAAQQPATAVEKLPADLHQAHLQFEGGNGQLGRGVRDQRQPLLEPGHKARIQAPIAQQRQQGGREAHGQAGPLARVGGSRLEHLQQRQVALLQGLKVPVLLEGARLPGAHIGKVGMEYEGQIACRHSLPSEIAL